MWKGKKGESDFVQIARKGIQGLYKSMSLKKKKTIILIAKSCNRPNRRRTRELGQNIRERQKG